MTAGVCSWLCCPICASNAEDETDPRFVGCCDGVSCVGLMCLIWQLVCVVDCAALICASNAEDETDPRFVGCCDGVSCVGLMCLIWQLVCVVDCAALICASNAVDESYPWFVGCRDGVTCVGLMCLIWQPVCVVDCAAQYVLQMLRTKPIPDLLVVVTVYPVLGWCVWYDSWCV